MVPSEEPDRTCRASGDTASDRTQSVWPRSFDICDEEAGGRGGMCGGCRGEQRCGNTASDRT
eukprot:26783-Chlamydomonas_euryale.AAC.1